MTQDAEISDSWVEFAHVVFNDAYPLGSPIDRWLASLTVRQRLVLFLITVQDLDQREVATVLDRSESAVSMVMHRIRHRIINLEGSERQA